jgi:serine/threonine protein phosphatase PrpC
MGHDLMSETDATAPDLTAEISPKQTDRWRAAAASVRGTSHEKSGTACQDSHSLLTLPENVLLAAISDGAGSASRSEIGSELAARTAIENLHRWCALPAPWPATDAEWSNVMRAAMEAARNAVEREAEIQGVSSRDMAATLIVLLATPCFVVAGQIGDGAAVVADAENNLTALTTPQSGEYLNETTFLVSPRAVEQAQTTVWRGRATFLAAFSDGLQMLALRMSDGTPHAPFFTPLFRFLQDQQDMGEAGQQLNAFLTSPRITQRADDDLTLLLAYLPG